MLDLEKSIRSLPHDDAIRWYICLAGRYVRQRGVDTTDIVALLVGMKLKTVTSVFERFRNLSHDSVSSLTSGSLPIAVEAEQLSSSLASGSLKSATSAVSRTLINRSFFETVPCKYIKAVSSTHFNDEACACLFVCIGFRDGRR